MQARFKSTFTLLLLVGAIAAGPVTRARAANMYAFDLESLAYMGTAVIEGNVVSGKTVNWVDVLNVRVTRTYAGDIKPGSQCIVGLSAYGKKKGDFESARFGAGDHLVLFIEPVTQEQWKHDGIPYWPVPSGVKLIADGKVKGMLQEANPGPYLTVIDDGDAKSFPQKVEAAVKWAQTFRRELATHKADAAWLLENLHDRPVRGIEVWGWRDDIAVTLCSAIAATHDKPAIAAARARRTDSYERQLLDQN
jgi:hypothetical protein